MNGYEALLEQLFQQETSCVGAQLAQAN